MKEYVANSIYEFIQAAFEFAQEKQGNPWWRGHASAKWDVEPSIHQKGRAEDESAMGVYFRQQAKVRHADVPDNNDHAGWLFLMQHYGLPTRLLDWSESSLIALFFALDSKEFKDHDAMVWGIKPSVLNFTQTGVHGILKCEGEKVQPLLEAASSDVLSNADGKALAIGSQHIDIRQMVQLSQFTIHDTTTPLNNMPKANEFLRSIRIPSTSKHVLREQLAQFQITRASLYPDLYNLAKHVEGQEYFRK
jgi:FRG domain